MSAIFYGTVPGLAYLPLFHVMRALLNWAVPVIFGLFVVEHRHYYSEFRETIERSFLYGVLLLGAYGIYQFFVLPEWDRTWMLNVQLNTFGLADSMKTRVFSTMNGPAVYSATMACGLSDSVQSQGKAAAACRGKRISGADSIPEPCLLDRFRRRLHLSDLPAETEGAPAVGLAAAASVVVLLGFAQIPGIREIVADRMATLTQPEQDASFSARVEGHEQAIRKLAAEPWGEGMGSTDALHGTEGDDDNIGPPR